MRRLFTALAVAFVSSALLCQAAEAGPRKHRRAGVAPGVTAAGVGVGIASTAGYFAITKGKWHSRHVNGLGSAGAWAATTVGCAALSPIVATLVVKRPLTTREAHVLIAGCVVPFVGPLLVNAAFDAHPEWENMR